MPKERGRNPTDGHSDRHDKRYKDYRQNFVEEDAYARHWRDDHCLDDDVLQRQGGGVDRERVRRREYESADTLHHHRYGHDYAMEDQYGSKLMSIEYYAKTEDRQRRSGQRRERKKRKKSKKSRRDASKNGAANDKVDKTVMAVKALVDYGNGSSETDSSSGESSVKTRSSCMERHPRARSSASEMLARSSYDHHDMLLHSGVYATGYDSPVGASHRDLPRLLRNAEPMGESIVSRRERSRRETSSSAEHVYLDPVGSNSQKYEYKLTRELRSPEKAGIYDSKVSDSSRTTSERTKCRHRRSPDLSPPDLAPAISHHGRSGRQSGSAHQSSEKSEKHSIRQKSPTPLRLSAPEKLASRNHVKPSADEIINSNICGERRRRRDSPISHSPDSMQIAAQHSPLFDACEHSRSKLPILEASKHKDRKKTRKVSPNKKKLLKKVLSPHVMPSGSSGENTPHYSATPPMPVLSRVYSPRESSHRSSPAPRKCPDENRRANLNPESSKSRHCGNENNEVSRKSVKPFDALRPPSTSACVAEEIKSNKHIESGSNQSRSTESSKRSRPRSSSNEGRQGKLDRTAKIEEIPRSYQDASSPSRKKSRREAPASGKSASASKTVECR